MTFEYMCGVAYWALIIQLTGPPIGHHCCSALVQDANGKITHGRNMDYNMEVHPLTVVHNYKKNGKLIMVAPASLWIDAGVETAMKPNTFTFAVNYRGLIKYTWEEIMGYMLNHVKPLQWMIRDIVLVSESYEEVKMRFEMTDVIMPAYFIVTGNISSEGAAIARAPNFTRTVTVGDYSSSNWYLVQSNYDHWEPDNPNDPRRTMVEMMLEQQGLGLGNTPVGVYSALTNYPLGTFETVYRTVMSATDSTINTWVENMNVNVEVCVNTICPAICSQCNIGRVGL